MMRKASLNEDPMYVLLCEGLIDEFNEKRAAGESCDLSNCDFSQCDLREINADGLDMRNSYFRQADLRGIDFSNTQLAGASFASAKVSGALFPTDIRAEELLLSLEHGTRIRCE